MDKPVIIRKRRFTATAAQPFLIAPKASLIPRIGGVIPEDTGDTVLPDVWERDIMPFDEVEFKKFNLRREPPVRYPGHAIYLSRSFHHFAVTVGTTPTLLISEPYSAPYLILNANPSGIVYLGNPEVTIISGYPILEGEEKAFIIGENVALYAIVAIGTLEIRMLRL